MHIKNLTRNIFISAACLAGLMTSGCKMVTDDLDPCPAKLRIRFVYDYNIKWGDAFAHEVNSVNVWAFDKATGQPRGHWQESGAQLAEKDFYIDTDLDEGDYDFVSWCGLEGNGSFDLATYNPTSKEELEVTMKTVEEADGTVHASRTHLPGLFHADMRNVEYVIDPYQPTIKIVEASLMKDTKDIRVMLQNLDGSEIENRDFTVTITDANSEYAWNNDLLPSPTVTYYPWNVKYGQMTTGGGTQSRVEETRDENGTITTLATLLFEMSTGRLMVDSKATLTIHRNWDNRDIVRIPLIDYLLLVKGHYGNITDQEYLDRQDEYSMTFFIDPNSNWFVGGGIFINGWAVVPPQSQDF